MSDDEELPPSKLGTKVSSDVHGNGVVRRGSLIRWLIDNRSTGTWCMSERPRCRRRLS